ncbi:hypothetical protein [Geobacter sp. AOG2]|uniref:hypothetical protein n=1 Tax=Geobacter sp. AOG2 TaxID=1566347 RepID=UPI001CC739FC|nr:hypothetical protein [Geobacter sp. AOG2]GFE61922.1 hypothetical protein AOG2_25100 [Geobacter sp. AOG2]
MISLPEAARCFPFTPVAPEDAPLSVMRCHPAPEGRHDRDYDPFRGHGQGLTAGGAPETGRVT